MTRAALAALLLLAPLAGCASGPSPDECGASEGLGDGLSAGGGHPIEISVLHDERPNRDVVFCARLDGHGVIAKVMKGSRGVPNSDWMTRGEYGSSDVTIDAWIAGRDAHVNRTVDLTQTPYVSIVLDGEGQLRIAVSDQQIIYA